MFFPYLSLHYIWFSTLFLEFINFQTFFPLIHTVNAIKISLYWLSCCLVAQLCPTLCDPMNCSTPGIPVLHHLPELAQTHVHWVSNTVHLIFIVPFSSCLQSFPAPGSFPMSKLFASGGQNIGASDSASVLLMNIQDLFPLGLTDLMSLQSKGLSRVFSNTTAQKASFLQHSASPYGPTLTSIHDYWKNHSFDYADFCQQSNASAF